MNFVTNKLLTFFLLVPLFFLSSQTVTYLYIVFGYAHFFQGFYYQLRAYKDRPAALPQVGLFYLFCTVASLLIFFALLAAGTTTTYLIVAIAFFFIVHGVLNEFTIYNKLENKELSWTVNLASLFLFFIYLHSFNYPGFAFFMPWVISILAIITAVIALYCLYKKMYASMINLILLFAAAAAAFIYGPFDFTLVLGILLLHHYISWWIMYVQVYISQKKIQKLKKYLVFSAFVHLFFFLLLAAKLSFFDLLPDSRILESIFSIPTFMAVTSMHLLTSLLNEPWIKRLLRI